MSRVSGHSTGNIGSDHEARIVTYFSAAMLTDTRAENIDGSIVSVGMQSPNVGDIDDVEIRYTSSSGEKIAFLQAKRSLDLAPRNADFKKILKGLYNSKTSNKLIIATEEISESHKEELLKILELAKSIPTYSRFLACLKGESRKAESRWEQMLLAIKDLVEPFNEENFYSAIRRTRLWITRLDDGRADFQASIERLAKVSDDAQVAFDTLYRIAGERKPARGEITKADIFETYKNFHPDSSHSKLIGSVVEKWQEELRGQIKEASEKLITQNAFEAYRLAESVLRDLPLGFEDPNAAIKATVESIAIDAAVVQAKAILRLGADAAAIKFRNFIDDYNLWNDDILFYAGLMAALAKDINASLELSEKLSESSRKELVRAIAKTDLKVEDSLRDLMAVSDFSDDAKVRTMAVGFEARVRQFLPRSQFNLTRKALLLRRLDEDAADLELQLTLGCSVLADLDMMINCPNDIDPVAIFVDSELKYECAFPTNLGTREYLDLVRASQSFASLTGSQSLVPARSFSEVGELLELLTGSSQRALLYILSSLESKEAERTVEDFLKHNVDFTENFANHNGPSFLETEESFKSTNYVATDSVSISLHLRYLIRHYPDKVDAVAAKYLEQFQSNPVALEVETLVAWKSVNLREVSRNLAIITNLAQATPALFVRTLMWAWNQWRESFKVWTTGSLVPEEGEPFFEPEPERFRHLLGQAFRIAAKQFNKIDYFMVAIELAIKAPSRNEVNDLANDVSTSNDYRACLAEVAVSERLGDPERIIKTYENLVVVSGAEWPDFAARRDGCLLQLGRVNELLNRREQMLEMKGRSPYQAGATVQALVQLGRLEEAREIASRNSEDFPGNMAAEGIKAFTELQLGNVRPLFELQQKYPEKKVLELVSLQEATQFLVDDHRWQTTALRKASEGEICIGINGQGSILGHYSLRVSRYGIVCRGEISCANEMGKLVLIDCFALYSLFKYGLLTPLLESDVTILIHVSTKTTLLSEFGKLKADTSLPLALTAIEARSLLKATIKTDNCESLPDVQLAAQKYATYITEESAEGSKLNNVLKRAIDLQIIAPLLNLDSADLSSSENDLTTDFSEIAYLDGTAFLEAVKRKRIPTLLKIFKELWVGSEALRSISFQIGNSLSKVDCFHDWEPIIEQFQKALQKEELLQVNGPCFEVDQIGYYQELIRTAKESKATLWSDELFLARFAISSDRTLPIINSFAAIAIMQSANKLSGIDAWRRLIRMAKDGFRFAFDGSLLSHCRAVSDRHLPEVLARLLNELDPRLSASRLEWDGKLKTLALEIFRFLGNHDFVISQESLSALSPIFASRKPLDLPDWANELESNSDLRFPHVTLLMEACVGALQCLPLLSTVLLAIPKWLNSEDMDLLTRSLATSFGWKRVSSGLFGWYSVCTALVNLRSRIN